MGYAVLLIDDSESDLLFTRIVLERSGEPWEIRSFDDARDALAHLEQPGRPPVDLILLDINMPGMNGFEFLEACERSAAASETRAVVVMLTSSPDPSDRARALAFPAVRGYVTKPIDIPSARGLLRHLS
jgi:CheY-like chemotaxis protein